MRYGSKLLVAFVALLLIGDILSYLILNKSGNQLIVDQMGQRALSVAAGAAAAIDPEKLKLIQERSDQDRPEYTELMLQLRKIRDANRMSGTDIGFLYTLHPSGKDASILLYGIDAEERFDQQSHPGDVVHGMKTADLPRRPHIHPGFRTDQWGTWLIGRYPVRDAEGKIIAFVGADIKQSDVLDRQILADKDNLYDILIHICIGLLGALLISLRLSAKLSKIKKSIMEIDEGNFNVTIPIASHDEFGDIARSLEKMSSGLAERDLVKSAFARYVSHQVADSILIDGNHPRVHGERRRITVLFSDVRGFTTMSEKMTPEQVVQILNIYFEKMVDIVFRHGGTLDKFLGDGLMAIFGAPLEDNFQEENALKAAIEMRRELTLLNQKVLEEHGIELAIGIGINSGNAIVGNIGSSQRMEYTAIGDTVNLASRLESKTKELNSNILVSEYTYNSVRGAFPFEFCRMGLVSVKGRKDEVIAYGIPETKESEEVENVPVEETLDA